VRRLDQPCDASGIRQRRNLRTPGPLKACRSEAAQRCVQFFGPRLLDATATSGSVSCVPWNRQVAQYTRQLRGSPAGGRKFSGSAPDGGL